ncbi:3-phenylpropionate/trans-cinnamate dioxygenase ferredoxin subunit [Novosphingobium chloroacetimidivorans]|uniref:3-phenylpropionate/trans-cinnamate dioxygenase ferredoxin subunit n=1 Tax=Novosphingobium chloroacetimidivorans TaxID=1428314 RepID=A0A7W7K8W6_9SPHN|nr:Rieske 2Fe-2S domain-containing protein [Novosphingobium chloroacetimidivorans]MBB4858400.1 3-phenylpropionate/trans-cinnamate dioxygenase ferredoxin subunit [Novosphingobium chloroacetimidivorans]
MSEVWHTVVPESDFPAEGKLAIELGGWSVLIVRTEDGFHALNDRCTHQAAMLSPGRVRRGAIMCPLHGARFEVATGRCVGGAYADLRRFAVRSEGGSIEVAVPATPPGPQERPIAS